MTRITTDDLIRDLHIVVEDLETLIHASTGHAGEKVDAARERAQQLTNAIKSRFSVVEQRIAEQARAAAKEADTYVREHAWETIASAAQAGIFLGALLNERKHKR